MPYATEADLDLKWGADQVTLVSIDEATGLRSSPRVLAALDAASAKMDAVFLKRALLPLDPTPAGGILLRNLCLDIAMGELAVTPAARNEIIVAAEKKALDFLNLIAAGKADIPVVATGVGEDLDGVSHITPNEAVVIAPERRFGRDV